MVKKPVKKEIKKEVKKEVKKVEMKEERKEHKKVSDYQPMKSDSRCQEAKDKKKMDSIKVRG